MNRRPMPGTLGDLIGGGNVTLQGGTLAGQPYHSLTAAVTLSGQDVNLTKATLLQDGGAVVANGTFNLKTQLFLANVGRLQFRTRPFPSGERSPALGGGSIEV